MASSRRAVMLLLLAAIVCFSSLSESAKILALFPIGLKSHFLIFDSLMMKLAERGHNVTVYSAFTKNRKIANYNEIDGSNCLTISERHFDIDNIVPMKGVHRQIWTLFANTDFTEHFLNCESTRQLMNTNESYDLIITELFIVDVTFGLLHKFSKTAPYISLCANTLYPWAADRTGNPDNPSYITFNHNVWPLNQNGHSTFWQRLYNTYAYLLAKIMFKWRGEYPADRINRKYFGNEIPSYAQIAENVSLILSFSHFSTQEIQPLLPNIIQIGGIQIKDAAPLPEDIQKFIDESPHGVIYFSMGSLIKSETIAEEKRIAFLHAFSKVQQRVLWKWNGDLPGKTDNIYVSKWLPQRDILAHPKVKLFIAHCGALGINEAIYESVPVLGIPIFGDQNINAQNMVSKGVGEFLNYYDISNTSVLEKIQLILNNPRYKENMNRLSAIHRDRPMSPLDTAIYWTEYVIRHKGAYHLRSAAVNLSWYQYLLLDVLAFVVIVTIVTLYIFYRLIKFLIIKLVFTSKNVNCCRHGETKSPRNEND